MKTHYFPFALALAAVMQLTPPAAATPTALRSPETAHTYADNNSVLWHQLRWLPASHQLVATVTFSNIDYVSRVEPRHDETYNFPLPGVQFSEKTGLFSVTGPQGRSIPVARLHSDLIGHSVDLLPTARILITNHQGRAAVRLLTDQPLSDDTNRWVQR